MKVRLQTLHRQGLLAVRLRSELGMLVARATYFSFGVLPGLFDPAETAHDIHGGEIET